jgi:hypothetical protein
VGHAIVDNEPLEHEWRAAKRVRRPNSAAADEMSVEALVEAPVEAPVEIEQGVRMAA